MTTQEINLRCSRLNRELEATSRNIERYIARNPQTDVRKVAATQFEDCIGRFTEREIARSRFKSYDWYFDESNPNQSSELRYLQNGKGENRYFIIEPYKDVSLGPQVSIGQQKVYELPVWHHKISQRISSSPRVFAKMVRTSTNPVDRAGLWKTYDTVDEKSIIIVTLTIPIAIITAIELLPALYTYGQSSLPALKSAAAHSLKGAGERMAYQAGSEFLSNGGNFGDMNLLKIGASGVTPNFGTDLLGSKYSYTFNERFESMSLEETAINLASIRLSRGLNSNLGKLANGYVSNGAVKAYEITFKMSIQTGTKSAGKVFKNKLDGK